MAQSKPSTRSDSQKDGKQVERSAKAPDVIVDFVFDAGLFFIAVRNISDRPAYKVSTRFDHKIVGLGGAKEISSLPLFHNIEFLAPGKEILTLLDSSDSYFARQQPTKVEVQISYLDYLGDKHKVSILHDLEIYRDLPFIGKPKDVTPIIDEVTD